VVGVSTLVRALRDIDYRLRLGQLSYIRHGVASYAAASFCLSAKASAYNYELPFNRSNSLRLDLINWVAPDGAIGVSCKKMHAENRGDYSVLG
jgi:hypothetical protein